jgi:hypothetical protein
VHAQAVREAPARYVRATRRAQARVSGGQPKQAIRISELVDAEEILVATTASGPWEQRDIDQLLKAMPKKMEVRERTWNSCDDQSAGQPAAY